MTSQLQQLKQHSLVVADTGDLEAIRRYQPQDATTNPSLLLKAFSLSGYQALIDEELSSVKASGGSVKSRSNMPLTAWQSLWAVRFPPLYRGVFPPKWRRGCRLIPRPVLPRPTS